MPVGSAVKLFDDEVIAEVNGDQDEIVSWIVAKVVGAAHPESELSVIVPAPASRLAVLCETCVCVIDHHLGDRQIEW